jgi:hypothetical protein
MKGRHYLNVISDSWKMGGDVSCLFEMSGAEMRQVRVDITDFVSTRTQIQAEGPDISGNPNPSYEITIDAQIVFENLISLLSSLPH